MKKINFRLNKSSLGAPRGQSVKPSLRAVSHGSPGKGGSCCGHWQLPSPSEVVSFAVGISAASTLPAFTTRV